MDAYIELQLLPDPEFPAAMLMNALFAKLHRGLVANGAGRIGISFPDVDKKAGKFGNRLRLHGQASDLEMQMASNWLQGMRDHISLMAMQPVPENAKHRIVRRVQAQSSPERLRRRIIKRKGLSADEARQAIPDSTAVRLNLPYLEVSSHSTQQKFRLFIEHLPLQTTSSQGTFSAYGLSNDASIPWF
jgi:CRISPR-associated endonuclease Csy4